jgi:2-methylcitrate dehydratase PrpD
MQFAGGVDIMVNNAVTRHFSPVETFPVERAGTRRFAVNLSAAFHTIRLALPHMRRCGSRRAPANAGITSALRHKSPFNMTETHSNVSERLAGFVADARAEDIPPHVRYEGKRALLNFFATALGGCQDEAIETSLGVLTGFAGPGMAPIIGRKERVDALTAAFINAASSNVFDFDDTHIPTVIHPTAPVAPALLALADARPVSGADLLTAFVLGVEIECRIGNAVSPGHYRRGWHITATCGVFGAAAAAGRLLGLDPRRIVWAFGNASAQSSGLVETLGSMAKSIGVGNAARNGLLSALLAERGFAGPDLPLEGPRGFIAVTSDRGESESHCAPLTAGLGESWEILRNTYKPYPCGVVLNPVVDAVLDLRERHHLQAGQIDSIIVTGHPLLGERTDRPAPASGREAQVSAQHSVAVALMHGAAGIAQYTDRAVSDPATLAMRARVRVQDDATMPVGAASVAVRLNDGTEFKTAIEHARGSLERPLTDAELEQKLASLAAHGCPKLDVGPLVEAVWAIESVSAVRDVIGCAVNDS